jgi:Cytidylyltransferase family.
VYAFCVAASDVGYRENVSYGTGIFILYIFMLLVTRHREYDFSDISYICTAIGLSAFGISCVVFVSLKDEAKSCFYITLCLAIAWISDAGAYFVGSFLGKKKLCPK